MSEPMADVSKMDDRALDAALAEAMGWGWFSYSDAKSPFLANPENNEGYWLESDAPSNPFPPGWGMVPDYSTDPSASAEAKAWAREKEWWYCITHEPDHDPDTRFKVAVDVGNMNFEWGHAPTEERGFAEALLLAIRAEGGE